MNEEFDKRKGEILLYQTEDGLTQIDVRLENETVWLTQKQLSELFQKDRTVITKHIANIFADGELEEKSNVQNMHFAHSDKPVKLYNLDVIISVGYRVRSHRGVQFRKWATQRLKEYLVKGFTLDDERLKEDRSVASYYDELVERIRDIRTSEKVFYRKITDIYTTSIDYDPEADITQEFFATVQNKFHWAIHGHTAPELIIERADADQPNMGLTSWKSKKIRQTDVTIAKNYLKENEIKELNLIVEQYLAFAELQAHNRTPMYMRDWIGKLDDFLRLNSKNILVDLGKMSRKLSDEHAKAEYHKFREIEKRKELEHPSDDFDKAVKKIANKNKKLK